MIEYSHRPTLERPLVTPSPEAIGKLVIDLIGVVGKHMDLRTTGINFRDATTMSFSTLNSDAITTAAAKAAPDSWLANNDPDMAAAEVYKRTDTNEIAVMTAAVKRHGFTSPQHVAFGITLAQSALSAERDRAKQILHELAGHTTLNRAKTRPIVLVKLPEPCSETLAEELKRVTYDHLPAGTLFSFGTLGQTEPTRPSWFLPPPIKSTTPTNRVVA